MGGGHRAGLADGGRHRHLHGIRRRARSARSAVRRPGGGRARFRARSTSPFSSTATASPKAESSCSGGKRASEYPCSSAALCRTSWRRAPLASATQASWNRSLCAAPARTPAPPPKLPDLRWSTARAGVVRRTSSISPSAARPAPWTSAAREPQWNPASVRTASASGRRRRERWPWVRAECVGVEEDRGARHVAVDELDHRSGVVCCSASMKPRRAFVARASAPGRRTPQRRARATRRAAAARRSRSRHRPAARATRPKE